MNSINHNNSETYFIINVPGPQKNQVETNFNYVQNAQTNLSFKDEIIYNLSSYISCHNSCYYYGYKTCNFVKFLKKSDDKQILHDVRNVLGSSFTLNQMISIMCKHDVLEKEWSTVIDGILRSGKNEDNLRGNVVRKLINYYIENHFAVDKCHRFYSFVELVNENIDELLGYLSNMINIEFYLNQMMELMFDNEHCLSLEDWKSILENILQSRSDEVTMFKWVVNEDGVTHISPKFLSVCAY